jgi:medium-chain acyl-[acyl-carrier-protein] hydrolase
VRLFCFPYAGGSSAFYRDWHRKLGRAIEVIPVELPGRGTRLPEPPYRRLMPLIGDLETAIAPLLDKRYAFFGHSMGAVIAFELTRRIFLSDRPMPSYLFISGSSAPCRRSSELVHKLPDAQLIDRLRKLNGTPPEFCKMLNCFLSCCRSCEQILS